MELDFEKENGLIPAIVQDASTHEVLMLGFMNREALVLTTETGQLTFYSRSRKKLWTKGETSGRRLLVRVELAGDAVCHEGYRSCFFRRLGPGGEASIVADKVFCPEDVYRQGTR